MPNPVDSLPEPMKQVLTLLGPSGQLHVDTERLEIATFGSAAPFPEIWIFTVTAEYNVPPVTMTLEGKGDTLDAACGNIVWQFLEQIGMKAP